MRLCDSGRAIANLAILATLLCPATASAQPAQPVAKYALIVGCTEYQNRNLTPLTGPANDVKLWHALLTDPGGFAFRKENVIQLVGWGEKVESRPTHANIVRAFETLAERAGPDAQIVILLSGHGVQVPIPATQKDPLDPRNPESDGLDEVFLPADAGNFTDNGVERGLYYDQIGKWLDKLREKGAHVLVTFDCCHAGTMTRNNEVSRAANPRALGITPEQNRRAREKADAAVAAFAKANPKKAIPGAVNVKEQEWPARGSLVAIYAAQPFETAPELPLPEDGTVRVVYGLLSYTLAEAIGQRRGPLSYGELQRLVGGKYRAARGVRAPTPYAEGDLNREVLGLRKRPAIFVEKADGQLRVNVGSVFGLTPGSILSVHPKPGDAPTRRRCWAT